jgi:hypothetical protein
MQSRGFQQNAISRGYGSSGFQGRGGYQGRGGGFGGRGGGGRR